MGDCYSLSLPVPLSLDGPSPALVTYESPSDVRDAVETLGLYFKREFHYDFPPFEASENPSNWAYRYEAYLFHDLARHVMEEDVQTPQFCFGAACFRWITWENSEHCWSLQWVWFHPFFRKQGYLSKAWPLFVEKYGERFHIDHPLSLPMEKFLEYVGWFKENTR